jgi:predicted porin
MTNHIRLVQYTQLPENGGWLLQKSRAPVQTLENLEMKKTLVAIAALAAATGAMAQSSVTITGIVDAGYQSGKEFGQSATMVQQNGSRTSALKFVGVEDLGGGLKAKFQIGTDMSITANDGNNNNSGTTTGTNGTNFVAGGAGQTRGQASAQSGLVGAEQNYVGLQGNFGEVQFGTINTNTLGVFGVAAQQFGTAIGGGYKKGIYGGYTRYENSMLYVTPTFNGFSARFQNGAGNGNEYALANTTVLLRRPTINETGLNYAQGPVTAGYAHLTSKSASADAAAASAGPDVTTTYDTFALAYDFGVAKVAYGNQQTKNNFTTALKQSASNLSVTAPYGNFLFLANVGSLKHEAGYYGTVTTNVGKKNDIRGLGVHYNLSKNSYIYLLNEKQTLNAYDMTSAVIAGAAGNNTTSDRTRSLTAIGISTAF